MTLMFARSGRSEFTWERTDTRNKEKNQIAPDVNRSSEQPQKCIDRRSRTRRPFLPRRRPLRASGAPLAFPCSLSCSPRRAADELLAARQAALCRHLATAAVRVTCACFNPPRGVRPEPGRVAAGADGRRAADVLADGSSDAAT